MKTSAKMLALLIGVIFLGGCVEKPVPPFAEWVDHSDGNMTIKFPAKPDKHPFKNVPTAIGELDFDIFKYELSWRKGFLASQITYPVPPSQYDPTAGLQGAVDEMAKMVNGTVKRQESITYKGLPGVDVLVSVPGTGYSHAKIFIDPAGPTLFQAQVLGKKDFVEGEVADQFFDSMEIKPRRSRSNGSSKSRQQFESSNSQQKKPQREQNVFAEVSGTPEMSTPDGQQRITNPFVNR